MAVIRIQTKVGRHMVTVEGASTVEAIEAVSEFSEMPSKCGNQQCGGTDLALKHRKAKEFDFYSLKCHSCGQELRFGQTKVGDKLFPKRWEKPQYADRDADHDAP